MHMLRSALIESVYDEPKNTLKIEFKSFKYI